MLTTVHSDTDTRFRALCRDNRWKCTAQRRAIFVVLDANHSHPTVETVWTEARKSVSSISLDSVYRILDEFSAASVVRKLENGRAVRYDPDCSAHDHYVCTRCGTLHDFVHLESCNVENACRKFGSVATVELVVKGICRKCQEQ